MEIRHISQAPVSSKDVALHFDGSDEAANRISRRVVEGVPAILPDFMGDRSRARRQG